MDIAQIPNQENQWGRGYAKGKLPPGLQHLQQTTQKPAKQLRSF